MNNSDGQNWGAVFLIALVIVAALAAGMIFR